MFRQTFYGHSTVHSTAISETAFHLKMGLQTNEELLSVALNCPLKPFGRHGYISLNRQKLMYNILTPSIIAIYKFLDLWRLWAYI